MYINQRKHLSGLSDAVRAILNLIPIYIYIYTQPA